MALSKLTSQLHAFREKAVTDQNNLYRISKESPMERMRREIQEELQEAEKYRASILQNVTTFVGLSPEAILAAARSMEEVFYKKGEVIIYQDDIGDSFYVLEEGLLSVTRKAHSKDPNEVPKELVQLGRNAHFGEIALLTAEPRSATVTVISPVAKCLKMTKQKFDELLSTTNQIQAESRKQIGRDVLDTVPLFKSLTAVNKKKLLDVMMPMSYHPQSYICRQGTTGNVFFILTEGMCKVTVNTQDGQERELAKLHPGDFFGEVALIEPSNRRTANVISLESVNCLTLSRNDFNRLLKSLKVKILEHQATRGVSTQAAEHNSELKQLNNLSRKRRISGYNTHGQRDELRIGNILKRFARYTTESLWNSLYSRMYREMLLDSNKVTEYGKYAAFIMRSNESRWEAVKAIAECAHKILETDPSRRTASDNSFVAGIMKQRNLVRDRLCKNWPLHQYMLLCKKVKIMRVKSFRKIIEVDTRGTTVFLILRGAVRIFSRMPGTNSKVIYEEDLFPGEIFGEAVLSGMHTRLLTALSITSVDLAVIDDQDYLTAQDRDSVHMGTEEKSRFLSSVPMLRNWDSYKLLRLAHALVQDEVDKGAILTRHHHPSKDIYFIVNGRVDIIDNLHKRNVITTLLKYDYFGESGFLHKYMHKVPGLTPSAAVASASTAPSSSSTSQQASYYSSSMAAKQLMNAILRSTHQKVVEEFYAVATTKLEVLTLSEASFHLFDMQSIEGFRDAFFAKIDWRRERVKRMKFERAIVRKQYAQMHFEATYLPTWGTTDFEQAESKDVASYDDDSKASQVRALEEAEFTIHTSPRAEGGVQAFSLPPSPTIRNAVSSSRPGSPSLDWRSPITEEAKPSLSVADRAYQTALVHPLDDRMNGDDFWLGNLSIAEKVPPNKAITEDKDTKDKRMTTSFTVTDSTTITPHEKLQKEVQETSKTLNYAHLSHDKSFLLNNLADIPIILAQDYDLLMVSSSCHSRAFDKAHDFLKSGKRPLSGKTVSYRSLSPGGTGEAISSRPSTTTSVGASSPSHSRQQQQQSQRPLSSFSRATSRGGDSPTTKKGIAFYNDSIEENEAIEAIPVVSFDLSEMFEDREIAKKENNLASPPSPARRKSSSAGATRKSSSASIKLPFSIPDETIDPSSGLPLLKEGSPKKQYQFRFMDDEELLTSPVNQDISNNNNNPQQSSPTNPPVRRVSTTFDMNAGQLKRPASSPQLIMPSYEPVDANLMIVKPFSSKTPTAAMMAAQSNSHQKRVAGKPGAVHIRLPIPTGQNTIEQLMNRPPSKRKNSVIAIELDADGNEVHHRTTFNHGNVSNPASPGGNMHSATTPFSQYQQQHSSTNRPMSGNVAYRLPFLGSGQQANYSINVAVMANSKSLLASRHHSYNNMNSTSNSSGGTRNISIRGQYLMVHPSNSNTSYLSTPAPRSTEIGSDIGITNDLSNERRSNQPPRLLPAPSSGGSKLINQRRKNNI